jgi:hypothetical protein
MALFKPGLISANLIPRHPAIGARDIDRTLQPWRNAHRNFSDSLLISLLPGKSRRTKISQARCLEIAGFAPVAGVGAPMLGFRCGCAQARSPPLNPGCVIFTGPRSFRRFGICRQPHMMS